MSNMSNMLIRSKAPLRISFCGGGTDVSPYPEERGGVVLSATIDKYAYGNLMPLHSKEIKVTSLDYDIVAKYHADTELLYDGQLDLVKAIIKRVNYRQGLELFLHSDAPPGSGLGSSSTMMVCLVGLFRQFLQLPLADYDVADLAFKVERKDLEIKGGLQDQYAATFGGFNFLEFSGDNVVVNPLRINPETVNELHYRLLLCYTGRTRVSAKIIERQVESYTGRQKRVVDALDALKGLTVEMKNALLQARIDDLGDLLHEAWCHKKDLDSNISNDQIDILYDAARQAGATGGKILGAGGGGYLLLFCPFDKKHIVSKKLEELGGQMIEFAFERKGLQTWRAA